MSWNDYITTYLTPSGAVAQAGIFGKTNMQVYANLGDFQMRHYNGAVTQEDGSEAEQPIYEDVNIVNYLTTNTKPAQGFRMNGEKYQLIREGEGPTLFLKKKKGGACFAITNTLVIVGVYDDEANKGTVLADCNKAVEGLAEILRASNF